MEPRFAAWRDLDEPLAVRLEQAIEDAACSVSPISAQVSPSSAIAVNQNMSRGIAANSSCASVAELRHARLRVAASRCAIGRIARHATSAGFCSM